MAQIDVCDVCRNPRRKVKEYRVGIPRRLYKVLLCPEHSKVVEALIEVGAPAPILSPGGPKVWTMDEIKERKSTMKKLDKARKRSG